MRNIRLLTLFLIIISCSKDDDSNNIQTNCESDWNGQISIKRSNDSMFREYDINGAFYKPSEQSIYFSESNEVLNPSYLVQFIIYKPKLNNGTYTHTTELATSNSFEFRFGANLLIYSDPDLSFMTQPREIKPHSGFLTITKNSNCFEIDYELVTVTNDSIRGSFVGGFVERE